MVFSVALLNGTKIQISSLYQISTRFHRGIFKSFGLYKNSKIDRTDGTVIESLINFENKCAITLTLTYSTRLYIVYIRYTLHMINDG